jgi:hypothetical protein
VREVEPGRSSSRAWAEVPAEVGDVLRPRLHAMATQIVEGVRSEVPEYARPLEGPFGRALQEGVTVALDQFVHLLGTDTEVSDLQVYRQLGRAQLREGRTLDALQSAYRLGARVAWREAVEAGERAGLAPQVLYRTAEAIFAYIDRLADASVTGWAQEQALRAGTVQAHRHALVELLTRRPPASAAELEQAALLAGWPVPAVVAAVAVGEADPVALARRLPAGALGAALEVAGVLLVPDAAGPGQRERLHAGLRDVRAVLGPVVPWADAPRSLGRVLAAWPQHAAGRLGEDLHVQADDHLLELLLAAEPGLTADLAARRLRPLQDLPAGARRRAEQTLRAWLDAHGDVPRAASTLDVHPQTVRYRLGLLREQLGDALEDPTARLELALALRASPPA